MVPPASPSFNPFAVGSSNPRPLAIAGTKPVRAPTEQTRQQNPRRKTGRLFLESAHQSHLCSSVQEAFVKRVFVDATVVCEGSSKAEPSYFYAHKMVLGIYSDYFAQRLSETVIQVGDDVEPAAMRAFLEFCYFGRIVAESEQHLGEMKAVGRTLEAPSFLEALNKIQLDEEEREDQPEVSHVESHRCPKCPSSFGSANALNMHLTTHVASVKRQRRSSEAQPAAKRQSLQAPPSTAATPSESPKQTFECPVCKKKLSSMSKLAYHAKKTHNIMNVTVDHAGNRSRADVKKEVNTEVLEANVEALLSDGDGGDDDGGFLSEPEMAGGPTNSNNAQEDVGEEAVSSGVTCPECPDGRTFGTPANMRRHLRRFHKIETGCEACPQCGKKFANKGALTKHVNMEHGGKDSNRDVAAAADPVPAPAEGDKFGCNDCPREFESEADLTTHVMDEHMGAVRRSSAKFTCEPCDREYGSRSGLNKHKKRMHGPGAAAAAAAIAPTAEKKKSHNCDPCGKEFRDRSSLWRHNRNKHPHEEAKNDGTPSSSSNGGTVCEFCEQRISGPAFRMRKHLEQCHAEAARAVKQAREDEEVSADENERLFACEFCEEEFNTQQEADAHEDMAHPIEERTRRIKVAAE